MSWEVIITQRVRKTLVSLPKPLRSRILCAIDKLKGGPYQKALDVKPLRGRPEWRLRVGDWRVLFLVCDNEIKVIVVEVSPRGDAYK